MVGRTDIICNIVRSEVINITIIDEMIFSIRR